MFDRVLNRGGSRTAATSKMECFVIIVNGFFTKHSILDVAAALDPPLLKMPLLVRTRTKYRNTSTVLFITKAIIQRCTLQRIVFNSYIYFFMPLILRNCLSWQHLWEIKDTVKAFGDFENKQKSALCNYFWYVKICIYWKFI